MNDFGVETPWKEGSQNSDCADCFFFYASPRRLKSSCCAEPFPAFSIHPHLRRLKTASFVGDDGGNLFQSV
jgi:hypothetical protein